MYLKPALTAQNLVGISNPILIFHAACSNCYACVVMSSKYNSSSGVVSKKLSSDENFPFWKFGRASCRVGVLWHVSFFRVFFEISKYSI